MSDYSHTMTLEGVDVLDANGEPMPNVRVAVPGANGAVNDTFLTAEEYAEDAANSTTTTTVGVTTSTTGVVTTTTPGGLSTTTTTLLPCAGITGLQAADCRCNLPLAGYDGLKRPIAQRLAKACRTVDKAVAAWDSAPRQPRAARSRR